MEKKLILVTSPPACGKTYVAKALAKNLKHVVYLDKDTLIVLSKQIFKVAGQPYDRSSAFFQQNIRDYEYDCVLALAMEALDYDDIAAAEDRQLPVFHGKNILAINQHLAESRRIQSTNQVEQGAFAGAGFANDRDIFAFRH